MALRIQRIESAHWTDMYEVYSRPCGIASIHGNLRATSDDAKWSWSINGVMSGRIQTGGFAATLDQVKAEIALSSWRDWLPKPAWSRSQHRNG